MSGYKEGVGPFSCGESVRPFLLSVAAFSLSAAAASGGSAGPEPDEAAVVDLGQMDLPIVDHGQVRGTLTVKLALDAQNAAAAEELEAALPVLRAAARDAAGEYARLYASPIEAVDAQLLSDALGKALRPHQQGLRQVLVLESRASAA